ncbi:hypothetical protein CHUAL_011507 [Chamberlinius hualienensis]
MMDSTAGDYSDDDDEIPSSQLRHYRSPFQRRAKWRRRIPMRKTPRRPFQLAIGIENEGFHHEESPQNENIARRNQSVCRRLEFSSVSSSSSDVNLTDDSDLCGVHSVNGMFKFPAQCATTAMRTVAASDGKVVGEAGTINNARDGEIETVEEKCQRSVEVAHGNDEGFIAIAIENVANSISSHPWCTTENDENDISCSIDANRLLEGDVNRKQRHRRSLSDSSSSTVLNCSSIESASRFYLGNILNSDGNFIENEVVLRRNLICGGELHCEELGEEVVRMPRDRRSRDSAAVDGERRSRRIKAHSWDDSILANNLTSSPPPPPPPPPHPNNITNNNHGVISGSNNMRGVNNRHHRYQQRQSLGATVSGIENAATSPVEASCSRGGNISVVAVNTSNDNTHTSNVANSNNNNNNGRVLRRERKPTDPVPPIPVSNEMTSGNGGGHESVLNPELLPDILNSHLPPPYSTLPHANEHTTNVNRLSNGHNVDIANASSLLSNVLVPNLPPAPPLPPPPLPHSSSVVPTQNAATTNTTSTSPHLRPLPRTNGPSGGGGRRRRSRGTPRGSHYTPEDEPKHCCGVAVTQTVSIRWFIVMIAFVGLCCAVVGTVLGALKATGREHLTVSLLMIGVGIVLITVSGIAWRLTSHDAPSCRMMLGLHSDEPEPNRRFVPRVPPSYGRPHHPYAAMMYPEFQYRPPPPSYQASMQEYRLRLLLLDRHHPTPPAAPSSLSPVSPPPTYRSNSNNTFTRPPINFSRDGDHSRPPSYRSRGSSVNPCPNSDSSTYNNHNHNGAVNQLQLNHSRDPSLSLSLLSHESLFDVVPASTGINPGENEPPSGSCGGGPSGSSTSGQTPQTPTDAIISWDPSELSPHYQLNSNNNRSTTVTATTSRSFPTLLKDVVSSARSKRSKDCNTVTIVQTNESSRVLAPTSSNNTNGGAHVQRLSTHGEMEVLAHL